MSRYVGNAIKCSEVNKFMAVKKPAQEKDQKIDLQYILSVIYRRKNLFIMPVIVFSILAVLACIFLPRSYEAYSTVLVANSRIVDPLISPIAVSPDIRTELNTLSRQVMAWPRMEQLVTQLHLVEEDLSPVELEKFIKALKKRITVRMRGRELIELKYMGRDPALAQKIVNTLTKNFIEESKRIKREDAQNAIDFLSEQLVIYKKKLEDSGKNFSTSKIDSDLRIARNRKNLLEDRLGKISQFVRSRITREQNPVIVQLRSQLRDLQAKLANLMIDAKEGNPQVYELEKQIKRIEKKIAQEKGKETVKESVSVTNPLYLRVEQEFKELELQIAYLRKRKRELAQSGRDTTQPITEEQLATLKHSKTVDEGIYQMLLRQMESAYVSERFQDSDKGSKFTIIEYARLPLIPAKPSRKKILLLGLFLGCAFGAGLIFILEYFDESFKTVDEARNFLPIPFLGVVSKMVLKKEHTPSTTGEIKRSIGEKLAKSRLFSMLNVVPPHQVAKTNNSPYSPFLAVYHEPKSKVADEFRVIRSHVLNAEAEKLPRVIAVTSARLGEGKTTMSSNLAVTMAKAGKNTLLVDGDLRKGVIHEVFGISHTPGFIQAIKRYTDLEKTIVKTKVNKLSIMTSGGYVVDPTEYLSDYAAGNLFETLRRKFDTIIIDTPPVLSLPDTYIIGKFADTVLLVVQMEKISRNKVLDTYNEMKRMNITVGGFILTDALCRIPMYFYKNYYSYSY